uniref:Myosin-binding protein H n=1 Tax=Cyprinus carpio TaxID=7962 RepID=A0A8C1MD51_CYPCA
THPFIRSIQPTILPSTQASFLSSTYPAIHPPGLSTQSFSYARKCPSAPVNDVNDTSVTLKWRSPDNIGSGLDGYTVEYCKEGYHSITPFTSEHFRNLVWFGRGMQRISPPMLAGPGEATALVPHRAIDGNRPKIRLPRTLRSRYVKHVGEQINLVIPFIGKPKPVISWTKDGQPLDTKKVNIRNSDKDSILFIRKSERIDSGSYEMTVKVDTKSILMLGCLCVDLPGPPASVKLVDSWGFSAALDWTPPKDSGNTEITGNTIQKADKLKVVLFFWQWFTVLEQFHRLNATISDLVMGNTYTFRVFAENKVGRSETAAVTKDAAHIQKTGIVYKPPEYKEHNFSEAPKFTTPLSNRDATVGYTTKLLYRPNPVRCSRTPKIEWLKNQMLIGDDPKYRQINNQGVCSLEIRKPSSFDGGVYTCRAKNALGEATVACKLEVKRKCGIICTLLDTLMLQGAFSADYSGNDPLRCLSMRGMAS